jgi:hypothetical protein
MESGNFTAELIAPCGMNCGICKWFLAFSRGVPKKRGKVSHCLGCLPRGKNCYIKRGCKLLSKKKVRFCSECEQMPCKNLERLDKRYRNNYAMSMVENLREIQTKGIETFLKNQEAKYKCPQCGDVFSVHDRKCYSCMQITKG